MTAGGNILNQVTENNYVEENIKIFNDIIKHITYTPRKGLS